MKKLLVAIAAALLWAAPCWGIAIWGARPGDTYLTLKTTTTAMDAFLTTTGFAQIWPGGEGLTLPTYRPGICYLWPRYDAYRITGTPFESWPNNVRRLRVDSLGVNITGVTEFHNITTRFYGVINPTGTDMVLYAIDSIGTVPMPVSIGVSRYWTFQTNGNLDANVAGGRVKADSVRAVRSVQVGTVTFSGLVSNGNGTVIYCADCTKATPCAGSGPGAFAKRINGAWDCN